MQNWKTGKLREKKTYKKVGKKPAKNCEKKWGRYDEQSQKFTKIFEKLKNKNRRNWRKNGQNFFEKLQKKGRKQNNREKCGQEIYEVCDKKMLENLKRGEKIKKK